MSAEDETPAVGGSTKTGMQLAFWGATCAMLDTMRALSGEVRSIGDVLAPSLVFMTVGYAVSSALHRLGRRFRVVERPLPVTAGFALAGVVGGTVAATALLGLVGFALGGGLPPPGAMVGLALVLASVLSLWCSAGLMVAQLGRAHEAERRALVMQRIAAEARLRMLRHQLNPHFLFNALNSLATTIDEDRERAQRLVVDLSSLLRDALADDSDEGTLGDELARVERYLRIERARFEEGLHLQASIADELRTIPCLPLLLQPLVENAIKHGASGSAAEVRLTAAREDGRVRIRISNPSSTQSVPGAGVGLANVRERLVARYGAAHQLEQRQRPDGWVDVELSWPCETRR